MPNALTAARGGLCGLSGHSVCVEVTRTGNWFQSICGLGFSKWRCLGITPWFMARTVFTAPAMPAAGSRCPIFDLTVPTSSGLSAWRPLPYTAPTARISIASPSWDPVACASR